MHTGIDDAVVRPRLICVNSSLAFYASIQSENSILAVRTCECGRPAVEEIQMRSRTGSILFVWFALFVGAVSTTYADELTRSVSTPDLMVHYGVVPASHAVATTGSGAQTARNVNLYVLAVALFNKKTGERIENAHVVAIVKGPRSEASRLHTKPTTKPLEPVRTDGAVTYDNAFDLRWKGIYHIELLITRNGETQPEQVRFNYDQQF